MANLRLNAWVSKSPELAAHGVLQAIRALDAGDRDVAVRGYRALEAAAMNYSLMLRAAGELLRARQLIGGVVLGIARQGDPFDGDKDIDIALESGEDRAMLGRLFAGGSTSAGSIRRYPVPG